MAKNELKKKVFLKKQKEFFRKLYQKKWVRFFTASTINIALPLVGSYAYFIEPRWFKVNRLQLNSISSKLGLKIVQISDLHFGPTNQSSRFFLKWIAKINALKPDLVVITGDLLQWDDTYSSQLAEYLAKIKARLGVYCVLGNHDYGVCHPEEEAHDPDINHNHLVSALKNKGVHVLENQAVYFEKEGLDLIGLGDLWAGRFSPQKAFTNRSNTKFCLVLSHNPDTFSMMEDYPFNLMLSGHAHGGQVSFFSLGPIAVPIRNRNQRRGLHTDKQNRYLYVNRGLGYIFRARFCSRPEITLIEI